MNTFDVIALWTGRVVLWTCAGFCVLVLYGCCLEGCWSYMKSLGFTTKELHAFIQDRAIKRQQAKRKM